MCHKVKHDTIHLPILSGPANLHEIQLPVYFIIIAVNIYYIFDCQAKAVFLSLMIYI